MDTPRKRPELLTRILSAIVMAAVAIAAILAGLKLFALLVVACGLIVNWEWSRLTRGEGVDGIAALHGAALAATACCATLGLYTAAAVILGAALVLTLILARRPRASDPAWALLGLVYVCLPAIALIWIRSGPEYGMGAVLFLLGLAAVTDTGAYAGGRLIGGPKLAPPISPNKTWSGLATGILLAGAYGFAVAMAVLDQPGLPLALVAMALAATCQAGDLAESAVKRRFGAKDSSSLIPGHGGLLDRIDGLLIASLVAALIALRDLADPGRGLLLW